MFLHRAGRGRTRYLLLAAALAACGSDSLDPPGGPDGENAIALSDLAITTAEDTPATVAVSFSASDPSAVVLEPEQGPSHGALSTRNATWTYTPGPDFHGVDNVIIVARDARGASHGQATARLTITVTPVNDAPVAADDRGGLSTVVGSSLTIATSDLLANDHDVDGDRLTVTAVAGVTSGHGVPVLTGSDVVFTPEAGFTGTAAFTYTVSDGQATASATVSINVTEKPHAAPVVGNDALTVNEAASITIDDATLLANDHDPEGLPLAIAQVSTAVAGDKTVATIRHSGTRMTIEPLRSFYGEASFSYLVDNGFRQSRALVTLTIKPRPLSTDVSVTVLGVDSVRAGGSLPYLVTVAVAGNHGVDLTVTDVLPPGLTCRWTCDPQGEDTCTRTGTGGLHDTVHLGGSGSVDYMFDCTLDAGTTAATVTHTASIALADWITDTAPANNVASQVATVTH